MATSPVVTFPAVDPVYVNQSLLPALVEFWHASVLPAFEERDRCLDGVPVGWIPGAKSSASRVSGDGEANKKAKRETTE